MFSINSFNKLNLTNIGNACLILFIDYFNDKLGHFVCVFKIKNELIFVDSFGLDNSFYNKNIVNKYNSFKQYLSKRLQSEISTSCGGYVIFFIHIILKCNYNLNDFSKIIIENFPNKNNYVKNDKIIFKYIIYNTRISSIACQKFFCNNSFGIKYNECIKYVCRSS